MPLEEAAPDDVPSPIDLRDMQDAAEWERRAGERPGRAEMLARFVAELRAHRGPIRRVLELGCGPGFLAQLILEAFPDVGYVALDFSPAMHELAKRRLGAGAARVEWRLRDFKAPGWADGLRTFDAVVTSQAVHELRHKRHAAGLHAQVRGLLSAGGLYLVCDHHAGPGGMPNTELFMTVEEQLAALACFPDARCVAQAGTLAFYRAAKRGDPTDAWPLGSGRSRAGSTPVRSARP